METIMVLVEVQIYLSFLNGETEIDAIWRWGVTVFRSICKHRQGETTQGRLTSYTDVSDRVRQLTSLVICCNIIDACSVTMTTALFAMMKMNTNDVAGEATPLHMTLTLGAISFFFELIVSDFLTAAVSRRWSRVWPGLVGDVTVIRKDWEGGLWVDAAVSAIIISSIMVILVWLLWSLCPSPLPDGGLQSLGRCPAIIS